MGGSGWLSVVCVSMIRGCVWVGGLGCVDGLAMAMSAPTETTRFYHRAIKFALRSSWPTTGTEADHHSELN